MTAQRYAGPSPHRSTMQAEQRETLIRALTTSFSFTNADPDKAYQYLRLLACMPDPELHEAWLRACRGDDDEMSVDIHPQTVENPTQ